MTAAALRAARIVAGAPSGRWLQTSEHEQDEDDHEQHPDDAAWTVTPAPCVRPHGNDAQERQHKDDQEDRTDAHTSVPRCLACRGGPRIYDDLVFRLIAVGSAICTLAHLRGADRGGALATSPYLMAVRQGICCIAANAVL